MLSVLVVFFFSTVALSAPLILAALGGFFSERSGVINIALEGKMLTAACVSAIVASSTGSPWIGVLAALFATVLLSVVHWLLTQVYRIDHVVSGMALNAMALGGTNYLDKRFADPTKTGEIPLLPKVELHLAGASLSITVYLLLAYLLPILVAIFVKRSRLGLRLLAVGNDPDKSRLAGLEPLRIRLGALVAAGLLTGLAGALIADNAGRFTDNMTAGRGYIALAALVVGSWRPVAAMAACIAFGAFEALEIALQGVHPFGVSVPRELWQSAPYLMAVIALAGFVGRNRAPRGLGRA